MDIPKAQINILGTSHIAQHSARQIERAFGSFQPDIVAVELDKRRLQSLQEQATGAKDQRIPLSMIKQVGVTGFIFIIIGRAVQKKLGSIMKVDPGIDMLAAVNLAHRHAKPLHVVDQDILITMRHLSNQFSLKEKMRVVWDLISSPFSKEMKKIKIRLDRVPDSKTIETLMMLMRKRYPSLYNVLIVERNVVMARNLDAIVRKNPGKKILLVIGAGHEDDLRERLELMSNIAEVS